ncbi:hypothetical protein O7599_18780 [Streptomyces sp. WMMC500]|uniref:hypothetical protein n=1 Tax=Streptomyces sp. WMMC500 TaxID=3015154 RepID=UPI00248D1AB3|nr:hypothetical protein [Streptomyces sp. WMMC500]WBB57732.1 hypothetical protein O7599_18780 [Streptomyces sp. WMMC500]
MGMPGVRRGGVAVVAVCLGAVVAAGCGEESGSRSGAGTPSGGGSPSTAEEYADAARAEHDRAWPDVAEKCRDVRAEPSAETSAGDHPEPENPKYAENNAYKQTTDVAPDELCRGEAHAARIAAALDDAALADPGDERAVRLVLRDLGYAEDRVSTQVAASAVGWDVMVAGAGPCISGSTDFPDDIDVHGVYMEGGCTEPAGGH